MLGLFQFLYDRGGPYFDSNLKQMSVFLDVIRNDAVSELCHT